MKTTILWTGIAYYSLENCLVDTSKTCSEISSCIVGKYGDIIYRVEYLIRTNASWETIFFEIKSRHNGHDQHLIYTSDGKGRWTCDGNEVKEFENCLDIDIALTPSTNTLPINRIKMAVGEEVRIRVLYIDLLEMKLTPVHQKYRRLSEYEYHYENVPNDFEAIITVDDAGLVSDYPSLFIRTAALHQD